MELKDILAQPAAWLASIRTAQSDEATDTLDMQATTIEARIDALTEQKEAMMRQFDTAIEGYKATLAALQANTSRASAARVLDPAPFVATPAPTDSGGSTPTGNTGQG